MFMSQKRWRLCVCMLKDAVNDNTTLRHLDLSFNGVLRILLRNG